MGKRPNIPAVSLTQEQQQSVNLMAMLAFDAYHQRMHDRFGRPWPRHQYAGDRVNWTNTFWPVALTCFQEQWDPEQYVQYVLDYFSKNHTYIKPACLRDAETQDRYRVALIKGTAGYDPQGEWMYFTQCLLTYIGETGSTEARILLSPMLPFAAWFRLVYPEHVDADIFDLYGDAGRREFACNKRLRAFVRKMRPKTFAELEERWGRFADVEEMVT
jgi:hypothetical protein